jgi:hypothetical protein
MTGHGNIRFCLLTYFMEQSRSWEANQWTLQLVKKFPAFMEPESPSPYAQVTATCLRFYLHRLQIIDSPECPCKQSIIQTVDHVVFQCERLKYERGMLNLIFMDPCIVDDSVEIPTRCSFVIEFIIPKFIEGSACFERHTAHHQEL